MTSAEVICYPKASGNSCKLQIRVRFQRRFKQRTDEICHFLINSLKIRILQRHIVLIQEDDYIFTEYFFQAACEKFQRRGILYSGCLLPSYTDILIFFFW